MRLSYYTIDDLRLGYDPRGVTGETHWSITGAFRTPR